jgi:hypothetical protein
VRYQVTQYKTTGKIIRITTNCTQLLRLFNNS